VSVIVITLVFTCEVKFDSKVDFIYFKSIHLNTVALV
jgi:hypothetical protein